MHWLFLLVLQCNAAPSLVRYFDLSAFDSLLNQPYEWLHQFVGCSKGKNDDEHITMKATKFKYKVICSDNSMKFIEF